MYNDSTNTWSFNADAGDGNGNIAVRAITAGGDIDCAGIGSFATLWVGGQDVAVKSTQVIAGLGLTGGGTLFSDRTITLGTPSNITNSTTNGVTATSHTHALGFTAAEVYTGSTATATAYGLGHIVIVHRDGAIPAINGTMGVATRTDINYGYINTTHSLAGSTLTGTWRSRGIIGTSDYVLMQRTA